LSNAKKEHLDIQKNPLPPFFFISTIIFVKRKKRAFGYPKKSIVMQTTLCFERVFCVLITFLNVSVKEIMFITFLKKFKD